MRRLSIATSFILFSIINPAFLTGCGEEQDEFTFGEPEMLALVSSANDQAWDYTHQEQSVTVEFALVQSATVEITERPNPSIFAAAWACSNREFVRNAAACIDSSFLGVEGTVSVRTTDGTVLVDEREVRGDLTVVGLNLSSGTLTVGDDQSVFTLRSENGKDFQLVDASW